MTPQQVAVSAVVCKSWASAANSDLVRIAFLPVGYKDLCHRAHPKSLSTASIQDTWSAFQRGFILDGGKHRVSVCRRSGLLSYSASVCLCLNVTWGDDTRYWSKQNGVPCAHFPTATACLMHVWWLEIRGDISCQIPPGAYTVHWRLLREPKAFRWSERAEMQPVSRIHVLREGTSEFDEHAQGAGDRGEGVAVHVRSLNEVESYPQWSEVEVGFVEVPRAPNGKETCLEELTLRVELTATDNYWKAGLVLDAVLLRQVAK